MTAFGIDLTDGQPTIGWEALQPKPETPAEIALADARVELAEAWKEVDWLDEQIASGRPLKLARAQALLRAQAAQIAHDLAWEHLNSEKTAALIQSINSEGAPIENTPYFPQIIPAGAGEEQR
jgi:hypothetical protein